MIRSLLLSTVIIATALGIGWIATLLAKWTPERTLRSLDPLTERWVAQQETKRS